MLSIGHELHLGFKQKFFRRREKNGKFPKLCIIKFVILILINSIKGKTAATHDPIFLPNKMLTEFDLVPVHLIMHSNLKRAVIDYVTIELCNNHHVQWVLFFLPAVFLFECQNFFVCDIWISVPSTVHMHHKNPRFWNFVFWSFSISSSDGKWISFSSVLASATVIHFKILVQLHG